MNVELLSTCYSEVSQYVAFYFYRVFSFNQWSEWIEYIGGDACQAGTTHSRLQVCPERVICNENNDRTRTECKTEKKEVKVKNSSKSKNQSGKTSLQVNS